MEKEQSCGERTAAAMTSSTLPLPCRWKRNALQDYRPSRWYTESRWATFDLPLYHATDEHDRNTYRKDSALGHRWFKTRTGKCFLKSAAPSRYRVTHAKWHFILRKKLQHRVLHTTNVRKVDIQGVSDENNCSTFARVVPCCTFEKRWVWTTFLHKGTTTQ